jgi:hypothetical protein
MPVGDGLPPALDPIGEACIEAWNLMGGELAWAAVPTVAGLLGVPDAALPQFVAGLAFIRDNRG